MRCATPGTTLAAIAVAGLSATASAFEGLRRVDAALLRHLERTDEIVLRVLGACRDAQLVRARDAFDVVATSDARERSETEASAMR